MLRNPQQPRQPKPPSGAPARPNLILGINGRLPAAKSVAPIPRLVSTVGTRRSSANDDAISGGLWTAVCAAVFFAVFCPRWPVLATMLASGFLPATCVLAVPAIGRGWLDSDLRRGVAGAVVGLTLVGVAFSIYYGGWFNMVVLGVAVGAGVGGSLLLTRLLRRFASTSRVAFALGPAALAILVAVAAGIAADPLSKEIPVSRLHQALLEWRIDAALAADDCAGAMELAVSTRHPDTVESTIARATAQVRHRIHDAASRGEFIRVGTEAAAALPWFTSFTSDASADHGWERAPVFARSIDARWTKVMLKLALLQSDVPGQRGVGEAIQ